METKNFNEILLRRRSKLNIKTLKHENVDNIGRVMIMLKNIQEVGYTLSKDLIECMRYMTVDEQNSVYKELIKCLKEYVGADKTYNFMYPNFPEQVMLADDWELFINAIVHYMSFGELVPEYEKDERLPLFESIELKVIDLGTEMDIVELMNNLISSKTSLSQQDKDDMVALIIENGVNVDALPDTIPFKENVAIICKIIMDHTAEMYWYKVLHKYLKTSTDILRFVVYINDGDVSLATKTKFKSMPRKVRRLIIQLLDGCGYIEEDMKRYQTEWIRLGEVLHVGEDRYKQYEKVQIAFDKLRNNGKIETFGGKVDAAIKDGYILRAIDLLKTRPGELARMLDYLLRNAKGHENNIVDAFSSVANQISVPVLLQVKEHFDFRNDDNDSRVFFPKGNLAKAYCIKNELEPINENVCMKIVMACKNAIIEQFKEKEPMNKVYISDSIEGYCVPQSQRSASKITTRPLTRGSRISLNKNAKAARAFIWWTNTDDDGSRYSRSRVDIDLSAAILDENFNYLEHVSYTNLRSDKYKAVHSGDEVNGGSIDGDGVSEFLDVDIDSVVRYGGRYVIYQVYSYTGQKYSEMPNAMFGFMEREDVNSGEVYEAKTVEMKMDLVSESTVAIPVVFDCKEREFIWLDMGMGINGMNSSCANLEGNLRGVSATCYGIVNTHKPMMYDLALMNALARGIVVNNRDEADVIFDTDTTKPLVTIEKIIEVQNEKGEVLETKTVTETKEKECRIITPYNIDIWMSEML